MLFLLKNGREPDSASEFSTKIQEFLSDFERGAKKLNIAAEDVYAAKFAYCAAVDEMVLSSQFKIRTDWERRPLQLVLFGEQLAGEKFFQYLEECRAQGRGAVAVARGVSYVPAARLPGQVSARGAGEAGLSHRAARRRDRAYERQARAVRAALAAADQIAHRLKREVPVWAIGAVFALVALLGFLGLNTYLKDKTLQALAPYSQVVKVGPESANLTISLP
ncbi:DotU family type IV/VI secretion system protein [Burkholderia ambifaria]|uniref:DotU family type IV/VI secretion system protein n=1 Tax=Burkholderia ambifaria TaxID=152480 RepID=UPI001E5AE29D|nr:DotU family type IV/VI secretion system protein [Burkholderia ambifaria]